MVLSYRVAAGQAFFRLLKERSMPLAAAFVPNCDGKTMFEISRTVATVIVPAIVLLVAGVGHGAEQEFSPGSNFRDCVNCPEMIVVPAGSFIMGSPVTEPGRPEVGAYDLNGVMDPEFQHVVTIAKPFAVGKFEITFDEWDACIADRGCGRYRPYDGRDDCDGNGSLLFSNCDGKSAEHWGRGKRPVINVSWENAQSYLKWLSKKTKRQYRLLSEAEWEYAARAGTTTAYFWGDDPDMICGFANGRSSAAPGAVMKLPQCDDGFQATAPVGSYKPNAFGLYDMLGNVEEWTEDCVHESYFRPATGLSVLLTAPNDGRAWTEEARGRDYLCKKRITRGGSYESWPDRLRSANRNFSGYFKGPILGTPTDARNGSLGFRVARSL